MAVICKPSSRLLWIIILFGPGSWSYDSLDDRTPCARCVLERANQAKTVADSIQG